MTLPVSLDDFQRTTETGPGPEAEIRLFQEPLPHVVAWNMTRRCNLACAHCYISAGPWHGDEGELTLDECKRISDEIFELARCVEAGPDKDQMSAQGSACDQPGLSDSDGQGHQRRPLDPLQLLQRGGVGDANVAYLRKGLFLD